MPQVCLAHPSLCLRCVGEVVVCEEVTDEVLLKEGQEGRGSNAAPLNHQLHHHIRLTKQHLQHTTTQQHNNTTTQQIREGKGVEGRNSFELQVQVLTLPTVWKRE